MTTLIDVPTSACVGSATMTLTRAIGSTMSPFTYEEQFFKWQGERWSIDFEMPTFTSRAVAGEWKAFALQLEGKLNRFLFGDPSAKTPLGSALGTPVVDGAGQDGNSLSTVGWTPSTNNLLRKGDYFQLGTGLAAKLYMVTNDVNSNGSGAATISFVPSLRSSPTDGQSIITNNPRSVFRLKDNSFSWSMAPGGLYRISFQAEEVVNA